MSVHSNEGEALHVAYQIKKAAVLGSGVMGSGIAAHLANIGIPTLLLDIVPNEVSKEEEVKGLTLEHLAVRNRFAQTALQKLVKAKTSTTHIYKELAVNNSREFRR